MAITLTNSSSHHASYTVASVAATGTNSSEAPPSAAYTFGTIQVVWATITGTATYKLQSSNDNTNWDDITGATGLTTSGASGSSSLHFGTLPGAFIRLTITGAAAAGTLAPSFVYKRN